MRQLLPRLLPQVAFSPCPLLCRLPPARGIPAVCARQGGCALELPRSGLAGALGASVATAAGGGPAGAAAHRGAADQAVAELLVCGAAAGAAVRCVWGAAPHAGGLQRRQGWWGSRQQRWQASLPTHIFFAPFPCAGAGVPLLGCTALALGAQRLHKASGPRPEHPPAGVRFACIASAACLRRTCALPAQRASAACAPRTAAVRPPAARPRLCCVEHQILACLILRHPNLLHPQPARRAWQGQLAELCGRTQQRCIPAMACIPA